MAKMYQVDKMAIMANMAIMAFQLAQLSARVRKVNQIESIKMGVSRKIVLKSAAHLTRFKLIANGQQMAGKRKPPASSLQGAFDDAAIMPRHFIDSIFCHFFL